MGAAADSLVMIVTFAGVSSVLALIFSYTSRGIQVFKDIEFLERKPLILPMLTFVTITVVLLAGGLLPISSYHGPNGYNGYVYGDRSIPFTVYDEHYLSTMELKASSGADEGDNLVLQVQFSQESEVQQTVHLNLTKSSDGHGYSENLETFSVSPGSYIVNFTAILYRNNRALSTVVNVNVELSQRMASGHLEEMIIWDNYRFMLIVGIFFFALTAICLDTKQLQGPNKEEKSTEGYVRTYER